MPDRVSLKDYFDTILLGQQISAKDPNFVDYAGCDTELSLKLSRINILEQYGFFQAIPESILAFIKDLIKEQIKAIMASSEKMDNLSKLSFRNPKAHRGIDLGD